MLTMAGPADPNAPVALLSHVTLSYDSGTQALDDVSLSIRPGEHVCVLGANGSGKSTLASVVCGLLAPDEGQVFLADEHVFDAERQAPVDFDAYGRARRNLGLVFQNPDDQIVTTVVEEDVAFGPENLGVPSRQIGARVERELRRVAMTDYAKADPTRLSGGQKQRVAIAGALAMEPQLIVFDEPGSLLDVRGRSAIMRVMGRLHDDGITIVHITHFMEEALQADRVIVLERGRIALEGTPVEVFSHTQQIMSLGLEEPFAARLSRKLGLPWTCDEDELLQRIARGGPVRGGRTPEQGLAAAAAEHTLQAIDVSYSYDRSRRALDEVSLAVDKGSSVAIVGQTGSGKSTLLRLLCALEAPDSGSVVVNGVSTRRKRDRRRLQGTIGYVMQHPERQLFAETVIADVAFGPKNLGLSHDEVQRRCAHALELVGLAGLENASPFELSGGQQRLCAIAGILAMEPTLLILDEPTAGLDPRGRGELRHILDSVRERGVTIVQVTHNMNDAARADWVVVLDQARNLMEGAPAAVFCRQTANTLSRAGLGLPAPLAFANRLEDAGLPPLGDPLTMDALVDALTAPKDAASAFVVVDDAGRRR